ncbi:MAG: hypothetical protein ACOC2W_04265 [bacterium]
MKIDITKTLLIIIIGVLLILSYVGYNYHTNKINTLKTEVNNKDNLAKALVDSIETYVDDNGKLVSQKRSLQTDIKTLKDDNLKLNKNQKKLVEHIDKLQENNEVLSSAYIKTKADLDKLKDMIGKVDTVNKKIYFSDSTRNVQYKLTVNNALPYKNKRPLLEFDEFTVLNNLNVDFIWGEKKEGYPTHVKVTHDNEFIETTNIESYVIPNVKPNPDLNNWGKFKKWMKDKSNIIIGIGIGFGAGSILSN